MQYLDLTGLQALWTKIKAGDAAAKTTVENAAYTSGTTDAYVTVAGTALTGSGQDGHTNYVVTLHNAASSKDVADAKDALYGGEGVPSSNALTLTSLNTAISNAQSAGAVTVTEVTTGLDAGVLKAYQFSQNSSVIGTVNIPKDFLVKSGEVREIAAAEATQDLPTGTKVLDFVVNTVGGDETASHILIPVTDLVDVYTGGNGINVSNSNVISAVVDSANDNEFLSVSSNGLKVSGVSSAISTAAAGVVGANTDAASANTVYGAKAYADAAVANKNVSASGDTYVSASASNNVVTVAATADTIASLGRADSALQGVDTTQKGSNVKVTLGTSGKNVTVAVDETALASALGNKADKVASATSGHFAGLDSNGNLTDSGYNASSFQTAGSYKTTQTAVSDPTASGNATSFIDTISQNTNGEITVTKKTIPTVTASVSGAGGNAGLMTAAQAEALAAIDYSGKADKVASATSGNFAGLDGNGNLTDSGKKAADFDAAGAAATVQTTLIGASTDAASADTINGAKKYADSLASNYDGAGSAAAVLGDSDDTATDMTVYGVKAALDAALGNGGSVATQISTAVGNLDSSLLSSGTDDATHNVVVATAAENTVNKVLASVVVENGIITSGTAVTIEPIPAATLDTVLV